MKVATWAGTAVEDLKRIDDFYAAIDPAFADRVGRAAIRAARFLAEHPHAGPLVQDDIRKWRVAGTRHLLVYRVDRGAVTILRVHHGHENWRPAP